MRLDPELRIECRASASSTNSMAGSEGPNRPIAGVRISINTTMKPFNRRSDTSLCRRSLHMNITQTQNPRQNDVFPRPGHLNLYFCLNQQAFSKLLQSEKIGQFVLNEQNCFEDLGLVTSSCDNHLARTENQTDDFGIVEPVNESRELLWLVLNLVKW